MTHNALMKFYKELETMTLSEGDKSQMMEIARGIIKEVMVEHIQSCPHGIALRVSKKMIAAVIIGACFGSGIAGGGIVLAVAKLFI